MIKVLKNGLFIFLVFLASDVAAYIVSYSTPVDPTNPIVSVANSKGVDWSNELLFLTYLFQDEMGAMTFRTYPFTTISTSGFYRLASNVPNQITISASNVTLDLNGCIVSGGSNGIVVNSGLDNVTIKNGTISSVTSDGIQVNGGCTDITLDGITVNSAQRGIFLSRVTNGIIRNCELLSSNTGCELSFCRNIYMQNCTALTNIYAGFSLVSSTTCALFDCQSLSTGQGNTDQVANIYGFVNSDGYGNIFERCIANGTQGLTVTGGTSVVAGFALLSTGAQGHKIIGCEAGNAVTNPNNSGVTLPYGIWLQNTLASTLTLTALPPIPNPGIVDAVDWTSDGQYLAVGSSNPDVPPLRIYQYDRVLQILDQVATFTRITVAETIQTVRWSPDANFLATGSTAGTTFLHVYQFNRLNNTLLQLGNPLANTTLTVRALAWTPDGIYLASGGNFGLRLYLFNKASFTSTLVFSSSVGTTSGLDFSSDGKYLAAVFSNTVQIYQLNRAGNVLTTFASATINGPVAVRFSPDDNYLAVGTSGTSTVTIFQFNKATATLTSVASVSFAATINTVDWSSDGNFVVSGGAAITTFIFDRGTNKLTQVASVTNATTYNSVKFSPDGKYIAAGSGNASPNLQIYQAMNFPTGNLIMNNTTYCDVGNQFGGGIGISGSSIDNDIIGNVSYNNQLNYAFVCNVFNQLFGDAPTGLQNISSGLNRPILAPLDLPASLGRIQVLAQSLVDILI